MIARYQLIGLYTLVRRELVRMFRIASQVFLPPVITSTLYFVIFGTLMGTRIGLIEGVPYPLFIAPGLIMMAVVSNAYGNVSSSLFSMRFQKSIDELLVSPMHPAFILLGYTLGGILRGVLVAIMVYLIAWFFVGFNIHNVFLCLMVVLLSK